MSMLRVSGKMRERGMLWLLWLLWLPWMLWLLPMRCLGVLRSGVMDVHTLRPVFRPPTQP